MIACWRCVRVILLCGLVAMPLQAAIDIEAPDDPRLAGQYRALIAELRCPKCLNQNIAGSDSPISADLRRTVRELLEDGRSPTEIRTYLVERYGDFILYRPRLTAGTLLLWIGPGVVLVLGVGVLLAFVLRRQPPSAADPADPSGAAAASGRDALDPVALEATRQRLAAVRSQADGSSAATESGNA